MKDDVIYISINNWFCGENYPPIKKFKKWLRDDLNQKLEDDKWAKRNKLCINHGVLDMSVKYTISAPRKWVEKNCPELLTDDEYTYDIVYYGRDGQTRKTFTKKYSDFVYKPYEGDETPDEDRYGMPFRKYCKKNFGSEYYETYYWEDDDKWDDEDDEDNVNE